MAELALSGAGFLLLFLGDLFQALRRPLLARLVSIFGYSGIGAALFFVVFFDRLPRTGEGGEIVEIGAASLFALLLLYSVLLEIPLAERRRPAAGSERRAFAGGTYALVRHPGFLWFLGLAASLAVLYRTPAVTTPAAAMVLMNLLLVIGEDRWLFPRIFRDWQDYKRAVPFLIPRLRGEKRTLEGR